MSMQEYAAVREHLGVGRGREYGRGIFDPADVGRGQFGRTALSVGNVQESPRLEGRYVRQDEHRDLRSLAERFSDPSTYFRPGL